MRTLVIGYGNEARGDDGLGPKLAREIAGLNLPQVTTRAAHQLWVEDAAELAAFDRVIFVDASISAEAPLEFREIMTLVGSPSAGSHQVDPETLLGLARTLFKAKTRGYVLAVRGYAFDEYANTMSPQATVNLAEAKDFLLTELRGADHRSRA